MSAARSTRRAVIAATLGAGLMIAAQVAGKAARDALFLSHFDVEYLPRMVVATAALSVVAMAGMIRLLGRRGPQRVVPLAFGLSALSLAAIASLASSTPKVAAVLLHLQIGTVGAVLISGFWSVVNERFDPRAARRSIGRVAVGGTVGGLVGGLLAMGSAQFIPVHHVLWGLAALQALCLPLLRSMRAPKRTGADLASLTSGDAGPTIATGIRALFADRYLLGVAALALCVAVAEALVDYAFKARAQDAYGEGAALLTFFAVFYTGVGLVTFLLQLGLGRRLLERFGMLPSLAALPVAVTATGALALAIPTLATATFMRGAEAVMRSSLYRSGYELLFVPVAPDTKRVTKALLDVGVDRLGNAAGGLAITGLVVVGAAQGRVLFAVAALFALLGIITAIRLRRGYTNALETSMAHRALELELSGASDDEELRSALLLTLGELDIGRMLRTEQPAPPTLVEPEPEPARPPANEPADPLLHAVRTLRSGDADRVLAYLRSVDALPREVTAQVIALLAWDAVAREAILALREVADSVVGQITDALLSSDTDFTIRRRLPRVLSRTTNERAIDALVSGLRDARFEVRYQCGQALRVALRRKESTRLDRTKILDVVAQEVSVDRAVWESHRLIDAEEDIEAPSPFVVEAIRVRSQRSLQHVFTLLSLVFAEEPLQTAYRALHTDDAGLRGTALEYLETVLPARIHRALLPFVEDRPRSPAPARPREEVLRALLRSNRSIQMHLERIRERPELDSGELPPPPTPDT